MNFLNVKNRAIFGLSFGHFNIDLYAALMTPLFPLITAKLNITLAMIGTIIAIGHLASSILQPFFGYIADKLKHRIFMVWGLVLSAIFIPVSIKAPNALIFSLCLFTGMIGNAFFHPQVSALIRDFNKNNPNMSSVMGIFLGLGTIGYAIGPYLSTSIVENFGENKFLLLSLLGLFGAIFMYFFVPKMPDKDCYIKTNFFSIMKEILKNKFCIFCLIVSVVKSALSISFGTYIPFLLEKYGFNLSLIGLIVTLFFIVGGIGTIFSSKFEKLIGTKGVIILSFASILPLTLLFLYLININEILAVLIFILIGFFIPLSVGIILHQAQKAMPQYTGVISGVIQGFSWGLGALFLSPLGLIGQHCGIKLVLILMGIFAFFVTIYTSKQKF